MEGSEIPLWFVNWGEPSEMGCQRGEDAASRLAVEPRHGRLLRPRLLVYDDRSEPSMVASLGLLYLPDYDCKDTTFF